MKNSIWINQFEISDNSPAYFIAEAGVNHNGSLELALKLAEEAKKCGADCVKFQTYKTEDLVSKNAPKANYQMKTTDQAESQFQMLKNLELSRESYHLLLNRCKELDIDFLSTPYNASDADFLFELGVKAFKVASGQLIEIPFLKHLAKFDIPLILSTGMAYLSDVDQAVRAIRDAGNDKIIVLQCTTNYPSVIEDTHLRAMTAMGEALGVTVGYSDHTTTPIAPLGAVALGARVIEKHFTLDKSMPGPDHSCSADPTELKELISGIRSMEIALGSAVKKPSQIELDNSVGMRRSLIANCDIAAGTVINESMIGFKRPAKGLAPNFYPNLVGKKARLDIKEDEFFTLNMIDWE